MSLNHHHRVVIVGAGAGGLSVAGRLLKQGLDIALIEPSQVHYYQPLWTLVGGGVVGRKASAKPMQQVMPKGATWIKDAVTEFYPEENALKTQGGRRIGYDYLVVAPGIQIDWHKIKGLPEVLGKDGVCSNYSYQSVGATWENIRHFKGGTALFTFPSTPIKCGGAPQKIMYLAEHYWRKKGVRKDSRIVYMCAGAGIFAVPKYAQALTEQVVKPRGIETLFKHELVEILPATKEALFINLDTQEEVIMRYDMLHVAPPMSAPDFIKNSPLANPAGWVDVHKATLQHVRYPNIFSLGDASSLPTSKTAAAIRAQSPVLTQNLLAVMEGQQPAALYDGYTSCPLVTGYGKLILAEFDYDLNPQETFPFNQAKERLSMYLLKRFALPVLYWKALIKGLKWPWPVPQGNRSATGENASIQPTRNLN